MCSVLLVTSIVVSTTQQTRGRISIKIGQELVLRAVQDTVVLFQEVLLTLSPEANGKSKVYLWLTTYRTQFVTGDHVWLVSANHAWFVTSDHA